MYLFLISSLLLLVASPMNSHETNSEGKVLEKLVSDMKDVKKELAFVKKAFFVVHRARSFGSGSERLYVSNGKEGPFQNLNQTCFQAGGHVPSPQLEGENKAFAKTLERHSKEAYLFVESSPKFTNWAKGEPHNDDGTKLCVKTDKAGLWRAASCKEQLLVVCEFSFI